MKKVILMIAVVGFMSSTIVSCKGGDKADETVNDTTKTEAPAPAEQPAPADNEAENTDAEIENTEAEKKAE